MRTTNRRFLEASLYGFLHRLLHDRSGQEFVEYTLAAGFVAVACGIAYPETIAPSINHVFGRVTFYLALASGQVPTDN